MKRLTQARLRSVSSQGFARGELREQLLDAFSPILCPSKMRSARHECSQQQTDYDCVYGIISLKHLIYDHSKYTLIINSNY